MNDNERLKKYLLEMLEWFHFFCTKQGLRYYIIGGTMLGAIRHQGFIPWDDDIDVGMPRDDYEKFINLAKTEHGKRYIIESADDKNPDFVYLFAKLYDNTTTLVECARNPVKRGVYIDIFPLDGIGDSKKDAYTNYSQIIKRIKIFNAITRPILSRRKWYRNLLVLLMHYIPETILNKEDLHGKINLLCKTHSFYKSVFVGNLVGNWGYKEIMEQWCFGTPVEYQFEKIKVYGVEKPDAYLTNLYGNYMEMPPIEKRVSHHIYMYLNLSQRYREN